MAEEYQEQPIQSGAPRSVRTNRGQQRRRQRSVFQYITILFAAALVLLLYTFMMERRQFELRQQADQSNISNLQQQSVSAVQTLQGMTEENKQLKDQVSELNEEIKALKGQLADAAGEQTALKDQLQSEEKVSLAMEWFWQLNDAYVRGRLAKCRELIASMEEAGLTELLPGSNSANEDYLSPAERYAEIHNRVVK